MSDWAEGVFDGGASQAAGGSMWAQLGMAALGAAGGAATPAPAGPSDARGGSMGGTAVDGSGWNVTFGSQSPITAERTQQQAGQIDKTMTYALIGAGFLLAWKFLKKKS